LIDVIWLGHACFMLKGESEKVMFDPFKGIGLPEPDAKADIILCSHSHRDHNNAAAVSHKRSIILEGFTGIGRVGDISVKGIAAFHDEVEGRKRGRNSIYLVGLNGLSFCHLGDLGHELSASQVSEIGQADILFLPVGGFYTIGPEEARKVMESLKPKLTFPMHYKLPRMPDAFNQLSTVEDFIRGEDNVNRLKSPSFTVSRESLPKEASIIIAKLR
jgi:L-ascorbate metabolism protein UlaG (beta-lactamase superfamily)